MQRPEDKLIRHDDSRRSVYYRPPEMLVTDTTTRFPPSTHDDANQSEKYAKTAEYDVCGYKCVDTFSYDDRRRGGIVRGTNTIAVRLP